MFESLCGASVIYGAGMLELGLAMSLEQMVIDNDILNMTRFAVNGIEVNDSTLDMDDIMQVPPGGDYLTFKTTMDRIGITSRPAIFDRGALEQWQADGEPDLADRAHKVVLEMLAKPNPKLPDGAIEEFDRIIAEAAERIAKKQ